jgi:hypothetical protein
MHPLVGRKSEEATELVSTGRRKSIASGSRSAELSAICASDAALSCGSDVAGASILQASA